MNHRMLTGERPTGPLHIGHLFGTVANRVRLQADGVETFLVVADYQVITDRDVMGDVSGNVREVVLDYLAAGHRPGRGDDLHAQRRARAAPADAAVPVAGLRRGARPQPDGQDRARGLRARSISGLMLTYPVHQAADILFCHADARARGPGPAPAPRAHAHHRPPVQPAVRTTASTGPRGCSPRRRTVLGTDGRKMSQEPRQRDRAASVGRRDRPGGPRPRAPTRSGPSPTTRSARPEVANLLLLASMCTGVAPEVVADEIGDGGAGRLKAVLADALVAHLAPLRARRALYAAEPGLVDDVLAEGNAQRTSSRTPRSVTSASSWG